MSFIKHSLIAFLLLNMVRESVCDAESDYSMASVAEEQPNLGQSDYDLPALLALAPRDADDNINIGKDNLITGKTNTVQGYGNSITGANHIVRGNNNTIAVLARKDSDSNKDNKKQNRLRRQMSSPRNTIIGNQNSATGTGNTVIGDFNRVPGNGNRVVGNSNLIPGNNNRITGNNNYIRASGVVYTGNNANF